MAARDACLNSRLRRLEIDHARSQCDSVIADLKSQTAPPPARESRVSSPAQSRLRTPSATASTTVRMAAPDDFARIFELYAGRFDRIENQMLRIEERLSRRESGRRALLPAIFAGAGAFLLLALLFYFRSILLEPLTDI